MAQLASLLVPSVQISGPTWADGLFEGLESAGTRINQNRSFGKLADLIEGGGGQSAQQQGGFLSNLMPQRQQQPTGAAPVEAVFRGDPQGSTYQPFINTVRAGGVNNPYALSAIAATGRAESGWSPQNANRTWSDPSQSGQPGTAGGILSWRGDRLNNLARYASGKGEQLGAISPETQAEFFLRENPQLIQQLNNAGSLEEAQGIINNAWRFAGYDQPGGETARRLALARNYYANEFSNMQPNDAAAAIDMIAPGGNGSPLTDSAFDARFGSETTPVVGREALAAQLAQTNEQPVSGYVDPMVSVQPQGQTQQPAAFAPNQVADASGAVGLPPASGLSPDLGGISSKQIADLVRDPNTREIGLRIWQQRQTGSNDGPFHFLTGQDGTLFRANKQTGEVQPVGNYGKQPGQYQVLTSEERRQYGIPDNDTRVYQRSPTGQISSVGGPGQTINVNAGENSSKFSQESDKAAASRLGDVVTEGQGAPGLIADMQLLADLGQQIQTGRGAQAKLKLGPYAEALGIEIDGLPEAQAYQSIIDRLAPRLRPAGSGATSDFDARQFLSSLPGLGNTPGANEIINQTFQAIAQNKIEAAEIARRAQRNQITWQDAEDQISKLPNPYQRFKAWKKANKVQDASTGQEIARPTTDAEYDALPSGALFIDPDDGQQYRKP